MKASGVTLTDSELLTELTGSVLTGYALGNRPVFVTSGADERFEVREVIVTGTSVEITADVVTTEDACTELLRRYVAKKIDAATLRKLADAELAP